MTELSENPRYNDSTDPIVPQVFSSKIKDLVNLQLSEVQTLTDLGIQSEDDLSYIKFEDLPTSIPLVKRRKLSMVGAYLAVETKLSDRITMKKIQSKMNPKQKSSKKSSHSNGTVQAPSKSSTLKIGTNPLPSFSGDPWDYEKWSKGIRSTLGQISTYKQFMINPPNAVNSNEVDRDEEFFHMIMSAIGDNHALNVVEKSEQDNGESGHHLWKAMEKWYMDPSRVDAIIEYWDTRL